MSLLKNKSLVARLWRSLSTSSYPNDSVNEQTHVKDDDKHDTSLKMENILLEEYEFYSSFFLQQVKEKTTTYNFYILTVGIFASILGFLLGGKFNFSFNAEWIAYSLILGGFIHTGFFCRLAVINEVQNRCKAKMSEITSFYINRFQGQIPEIGFVVSNKNKPPRYKNAFSISMGCVIFGLFASLCFIAATWMLSYYLFTHVVLLSVIIAPFISSIIAGLVGVMIILAGLKTVHSLMRNYAHFRMSS